MLLESTLGRATAGTGTPFDFTGTWKNELGSTATFVQNGASLSGDYVSAVSEDGSSTKGTITGFADGDLIAFLVHWEAFQAITAWVGQVRPGATPDTISTLWQMTKQVDPGEEWASINAGADTFLRQ